LITYFIGSISAKNMKICSRVSKLQQAKGGKILRYGVYPNLASFVRYSEILVKNRQL